MFNECIRQLLILLSGAISCSDNFRVNPTNIFWKKGMDWYAEQSEKIISELKKHYPDEFEKYLSSNPELSEFMKKMRQLKPKEALMKIKSAHITKLPENFTDPMPRVMVQFEDGSEKTLFEYFPDELSFTADEFVGLTEEQAMQLRHDRDVAYIRS